MRREHGGPTISLPCQEIVPPAAVLRDGVTDHEVAPETSADTFFTSTEI